MESLNFADYNSSDDSDFDPSFPGDSSDSDDGQSPVPIQADAQAAVVQAEQRPRRKAFVAAQSYIKDEIARTMELTKGGTKRKAPKAADTAAAEQAPAKKRKTNDKKVAKADGQPNTTKKQ